MYDESTEQPTPQSERRRTPRGRLRFLPDWLYAFLRFIEKHIRGFYARFAAFLTMSLAVGVGAVVGFVFFADEVLEGSTQAFDELLLRWIEARRTEWLDHVMMEITALGNAATLVMLILTASVFLWMTRHRYSVYLLFVALAGGTLLNLLLKDWFDRPRPSVVAAEADVVTQSFPSGHAMSATIVYGAVAYLIGRLETTRALRLTTWTIAIIVILLIAVSRMYLGVHYPTDVVAGIIAGLAWTALLAAAMTALRYFTSHDPEADREVREKEKDLHTEEERAEATR